MTAAGEPVIVVPARRASARLPDKLLLAESGRAVLAHTIERCLAAQVPARVIAAVDGPELAAIAAAAGAEVEFTDPDLPSGTDRVLAALARRPEAQWIVNVQGDEAEIEPEAIDALFGVLAAGGTAATLAAPFPDELDPTDPAAVKVVADLQGRALYFSRSLVPYQRKPGAAAPKLHVGVYAFTRSTLERFGSRVPTPLELAEGLEQLRLLEHGENLAVLDWPHAFASINTRADYDAFLRRQSQRT
ncbi:MAG TPA: 3-deoxy-manno-octulosonate cytidylyltransferase [Planctomycetota bacterium]